MKIMPISQCEFGRSLYGILLGLTWMLMAVMGERLHASDHPVPESPLWLTHSGEKGPGVGKHIVLIAAEQEYRSEHAMPMLASTSR